MALAKMIAGAALVLLTSAVMPLQAAPMKVKIVDVIPPDLSGEINQDSEPFLAVDASDASHMVVSAFTEDPDGDKSTASPVFLTTDGGSTWRLLKPIPIPLVTADVTHSFVGGSLLAAGALRPAAGGRIGVDLVKLEANDPSLAGVMRVLGTRTDVDQPFVITAKSVDGHDIVYIGENFFGGDADSTTASIEVSDDGGSHFSQFILDPRPVDPQDGPSIRVSVGKDGTTYAAYFGWRKFQRVDDDEAWVTSDIVVARDDHKRSDGKHFVDLIDTDDHLAGRIVAKNVSIHWSNKRTLGQERTGSTLSLAVDPNKTSTIYVAWADNTGPGKQYTIHVKRSTNSGITWNTIKDIGNATCVALAVADNGTLGLLYHRLKGSGANSRWETHLEQTTDDFGPSSIDSLLSNTRADLSQPGLPYLGDYNYLLAVGSEFRGVFSANNSPDEKSFPLGVTYLRHIDTAKHALGNGRGGTVAASIDPFYFSAEVMGENKPPSSQTVASSALKPSASSTLALARNDQSDSTHLSAANPDSNLKMRLDTADVVMVGRVVATREASPRFVTSGGSLAAIPQGKKRISEHDPHWKEAVIQVERPIRGVTANERVVVLFPDTLDLMWLRNYPKFKEGQEQLFVLSRSHELGGALQSLGDGKPVYAPPTKQDVLDKERVNEVIQLLNQ